MSLSKLFRTRSLVTIALILVVSLVIYGFAAANTVPNTGAGDGSGVVSGYAITDIVYNLNATNPYNIDSINFTVTPSAPLTAANNAGTVTITINGTTWVDCDGDASSTAWECTFESPVPITPIVSLRVVAVE